jgi:type I restriction enzyme S subunit
LRHLASGKDGLFTDGDWVELPHITTEGNRLIQTGNIGIGRYREQGFRYVSDASFSELGCTEVRPGDVLICRLAEPVGRACLAPDLGVRMITSVDVCILRPGKDVFAPYLVEYLSSGAYLAYMDAIARGGTRDRVSRDQLGAVPVPLPSLAEQHEVAERLADLRRRSDDLAGLLDRQIQFLEERRHALITAAVTGQFEIPGVAA